MPDTFRFQSSKIFLTYPRYGDTESVQQRIRREPNIRCYLIAHEHHKDGSPHLHCYVELSAKLRTRDQRYWDVDGRHPNCQAVRSKIAVLEYCGKDDNFIAEKKIGEEWEEWKVTIKRRWSDLLTRANCKTEFLDLCREHFPREFILQNSQLEQFAASYFKPKDYTPRFTNFTVDPMLSMWVWLYVHGRQPTLERPRSLIVSSPSRYGKTEWARAQGKHWYMCGQYNIEKIDQDAWYGVIDDISPEFFKAQYKQFLGCQKEFETTDKYRKKCTIRFGKPVIFLCNPPEMDNIRHFWDYEWVKANCDIVELENKLY